MSEQPYLGGSSFPLLYSSKRSRHLPETPDWMDRRDFNEDALADMGWAAWTDVLIDFRLATMRDPLPRDLTAASRDGSRSGAIRWGSDAPGWSLEGWYWRVNRHDVNPDDNLGPHDWVSVARFTDPDGFRFAFAVSLDRPQDRHEFANGRMAFILSPMRTLFTSYDSPGRKRNRSARVTADTDPSEPVEVMGPRLRLDGFKNAPYAGYSLPTLRDAIKDPDGWFGPEFPHWRTEPFKGPFRDVDGTRVLLSWAGAGEPTFSPAVQQFVEAGMEGPEASAWHTLNNVFDDKVDPDTGEVTPAKPADGATVWTEPDMCEWFAVFGGGRTRRMTANRFRMAGLDPARAARWQHVVQSTSVNKIKTLVDAFESQSWTPEGATAMLHALQDEKAREQRAGNFHGGWPDLDDVAQWMFLPCEQATRYVRAGIPAAEAQALVESGNPVDAATLDVMAALRAEPADPFDPYF